MFMKYFEYDVPKIYLYHTSTLEDLNSFNEILWGIEEEGIPCEVLCINEELSSEELAYRAAEKAKLSVGIGIDSLGRVTLTTVKLKKEEPLFLTSLNDDVSNLRALGANAGRLVKGIAFK